MMRALWTASSGMQAQQMNVDVISNNLANVNTTGYKKSTLEFKDLLYENINKPGIAQDGSGKPVGLQIGLGVRPIATQKYFTTGSVQQTGNPLDLAITGEEANTFFAVSTGNSQVRYTRDGSFELSVAQDGTRTLVTSTGDPVLSQDGNAITVPADVSTFSISKDGTITYQDANQQTQTIGTIGLFRFANPAGLLADGDSYYESTSASGQPAIESQTTGSSKSTLLQGYLEGSNVQVVEEMVKLITAQRAYEINSKSISTADDMLSTVNNLKR